MVLLAPLSAIGKPALAASHKGGVNCSSDTRFRPDRACRRSADGPTMQLALYEPDIAQNTGTILRLARVPRGRGAHHRAGRLPGLRPRLPPRRNGLPRSGDADAARLVGGVRANGGARATSSWCCSPPGPRPRISIAASPTTTSCCSAANPPACRTRSTRRPTRGSRSRCATGLRSLNVAMACAMVVGEALRQTRRAASAYPGKVGTGFPIRICADEGNS